MAITHQPHGRQMLSLVSQLSNKWDWCLGTHLREQIETEWEWDRMKWVTKVAGGKHERQNEQWWSQYFVSRQKWYSHRRVVNPRYRKRPNSVEIAKKTTSSGENCVSTEVPERIYIRAMFTYLPKRIRKNRLRFWSILEPKPQENCKRGEWLHICRYLTR